MFSQTFLNMSVLQCISDPSLEGDPEKPPESLTPLVKRKSQ